MEQAEGALRVLVEKSAHGDTESSRVLYEQLVVRLFPFIRSRSKTKEEAIDITQDVFIDFFSSLTRFSFTSSAQLYAYLFVIARRKLARGYREHIKKGENTQVQYDDEIAPHSTTEQDYGVTLEIEEALKVLQEDTREILVLHHWSRHTFGEIAVILGMSESAVRVRHHRALTQLKDYLNKGIT